MHILSTMSSDQALDLSFVLPCCVSCLYPLLLGSFETYHPFFLKEHGFSRQAPKWLCDDYCMHSAGPHLLCQWRCKQRLCNHCHHHDAHRCHRAIASFTFVFGSFRGSRLWPSQRRASRNPSPQTQGRRLLRCRLCRLPGIRVLQRRPEHLCFSI